MDMFQSSGRSNAGQGQRLSVNLRVMQEPIVNSRNFYYFKVALTLIGVSSLLYLFHNPLGGPGGGTWLGYTLGAISTGLIFWLAWFGVRKRRYGLGKVPLHEWVSAHVYLGLSLIVLVTLHTGFQAGWNVHTLAYVLMLLVILSGIIGLYLYVRLPAKMSENRAGMTFDELMTLTSELDSNSLALGMKLGDEANQLVREAVDNTRVGGGLRMQLLGFDKNCPTAKALERVSVLARSLPRQEAEIGRQLVLLLARKNEMLRVSRRDVQYRAWLNIWLLFHVPATVGLLVALVTHVFSVFFYW